jgi:hypothetical protein
MARGLAFLFFAGATLVFLTLLLPHDASTNDVGVAVPPALAYLVTVVLLAGAGRISVAGLQAILACGTVLITGCVYFGGDSASAYPLMYMWVALYAAALFSRRAALGHILLCGLCYAISFHLHDNVPVPWVHWLMGMGTFLVGGALISRLTMEVRSQAADLAVVAEKERRALEINDNIVQGLVVAKYSAEAGRTGESAKAIDDTLDRARRLITDQLDDDVGPGDLVRAEAPGL